MKQHKNQTIGVIGLGYVGLPLLLLINKKFKVLGFDINKQKVEMIKNNNLLRNKVIEIELTAGFCG